MYFFVKGTVVYVYFIVNFLIKTFFSLKEHCFFGVLFLCNFSSLSFYYIQHLIILYNTEHKPVSLNNICFQATVYLVTVTKKRMLIVRAMKILVGTFL